MKNKKIFKYLSIFLIIVAFIGLWYFIYEISTFNFAGDSVYIEKNRISSPDSLVDAVLVERQGGATVSNGYNVYLVPKGAAFQKGYENIITDHISNFNIKWDRNKLLKIEYDQARIFKFSNFWNSDKVNNWEYTVEIRLVPLIDSSSFSNRNKN